MKKALKWLLLVVLVGLVVAALMVQWPIEVEVIEVRKGTIEESVVEEARTRLETDFRVSMPVDGRLLRIDLKEGDRVESDDVVARIDRFEREEKLSGLEARQDEIEALIVGVDVAKPKAEDIAAAALVRDEARARYAAAQKAHETSRINLEQEEELFKRRRELFREGAITETEYIEAERTIRMLRAGREEAAETEQAMKKYAERSQVELERLRDSVDDNEYQRVAYKAQLDRVRTEMAILLDELAKSEIRSPASGPVLDVFQEDEQVLPAGTPLLKVGDLESIRIEADVLSEDVGRMDIGQAVEVFGPAVDGTVIGQIERIYPAGFKKISALGIEEQRVRVIIAFDRQELPLRPGVRVDVRFITDRAEDVLVVPERALFMMAGEWHVFVARDGVAERRAVEVGIRSDEDAEIRAGLDEGDLIIYDPPPELDEGARIRPREAVE